MVLPVRQSAYLFSFVSLSFFPCLKHCEHRLTRYPLPRLIYMQWSSTITIHMMIPDTLSQCLQIIQRANAKTRMTR